MTASSEQHSYKTSCQVLAWIFYCTIIRSLSTGYMCGALAFAIWLAEANDTMSSCKYGTCTYYHCFPVRV